MKRVLAILLLTLYINSYTEFHEAFRLPVLIEHYAEHKQQVKDMSFWEFLTMHYKSDTSHDSTDGRLPFKDRGHCFTAAIMVVPVQKIMLRETSEIAAVSHSSIYCEANFSSFLSDIFQPPRKG